ncbi:LOW QUALITY PROTEIN: cadherin-related family member 3-like [Dugong dugon]
MADVVDSEDLAEISVTGLLTLRSVSEDFTNKEEVPDGGNADTAVISESLDRQPKEPGEVKTDEGPRLQPSVWIKSECDEKVKSFSVISSVPYIAANIQVLINPVNLPENMLPGTQLSRAYGKDIAGKADVYHFMNKTKDFITDCTSQHLVHNQAFCTVGPQFWCNSTKIFNYEIDPRSFLLIVDTGGPMRCVLTVYITDVPEPPDCTADPQFSSGSATLEVDEDYPLFQSVYRVMATNKDSAKGDKVMYTIETQLSGPKKGAKTFGVDPVSDVVSLRGADLLDFDAGYHVFQLALRATDTTGLFCQGTLIITIRNVNDEKPQFDAFPLDSINVTENKPVGEIIVRVKATDRDEDSSITYSFKTQQAMFDLDSFTGIITLLRPLNLDNPNNTKAYPLGIEARDNENNTSTYMCIVSVKNVDDPVICDSSFSTGAVDATTCFALDPRNGVISKTSKLLLDYETDPKHFQIVIAVRNRGNRTLESRVGIITINIQNVNDESPILTRPIYIPDASINIYEKLLVRTKLVKLTATDRDIGDSVHYEFIGTQKEFSINEDSREVTVTYPSDYEDATTPHSWVLYFRAYDNERVHSTTGRLTAILQDLNDNPSQCTQNIYIIELPKHIPVETLLVSQTCTDKDGTEPNNNITYHLITDTFSNEAFTLTNNELKIGLTHLDYDNAIFAGMQFKYTLFVRVCDGGNPVLSTIITIIIRVRRINELNPIGTTSTFTFSILENSPTDTLVGKISFTDADPLNNIKYTIVGGNFGKPPKFYIEADTGMIKLLNSLDREVEPQYKIAVRITDLDNDAIPDPLKQRSSTAQVIINVLKMNDEPPVCNPPHLEIRIYSIIQIPFIQLNCSDKDSPQEELSYSIGRGNTNYQFTLWRGVDPPSLATTQTFQYDVFQGIQDPVTFQLLIEVTDELSGNKASQLSATTTVIIHVFSWTTMQPTSATKTTTTTVST